MACLGRESKDVTAFLRGLLDLGSATLTASVAGAVSNLIRFDRLGESGGVVSGSLDSKRVTEGW